MTALSPAPPAAGAAARRWWQPPSPPRGGGQGSTGPAPTSGASESARPSAKRGGGDDLRAAEGAGETRVVGEEIRASGGAGGRRATGPAPARPGRPAAAGLPGAAVPGPGEESPPVNALEGPRVAVLWCSSSMALCAWVWALDRRLARAPLPCARSRSTAMGESAGVGLVRATSCRRGGNSEERALDRHAAGAPDGLECRLD